MLVSLHGKICYNMNSAREKQATQSGICFSCAFNEQTVCEADNEHEVRVCEYDSVAREKQATFVSVKTVDR